MKKPQFKVFKNKKAFEMVTGIILTIFIILTLIMLLAQFIGSSSVKADEKRCLADAIMNSAIKEPISGVDLVKLTNCPPADPLTITSKDLDKDRKQAEKYIKDINIKFKGTFTETSPILYNANKIVAEQMRSCWSKLGEGNLNLFGAWKNFIESGTKCVLCGTIRFDEGAINKIKLANNGDTIVTNLREWLNGNPVPGTSPQISFTEYFKDKNTKVEATEISDLFLEHQKYDVSERTAIVFVRYAPSKIKNILKKILTTVTDNKNAENLAHYDTVKVIPYTPQALSELCNYIMN